MHTWQTELLKELKNQPQSADMDNLINNLENGLSQDPGVVAAELNRIGFNYFADKVDQNFYHFRARDENKADGIKLGHTDVLKEDQADETTGRVEHSKGNDNAVPASKVTKSTTADNKGV